MKTKVAQCTRSRANIEWIPRANQYHCQTVSKGISQGLDFTTASVFRFWFTLDNGAPSANEQSNCLAEALKPPDWEM
jgi:hypothetical protein